MPFQTNASDAVRRSQEYWRLFQRLTPGDLFECDQGLTALAIGPNSDIAEVLVYYFEPSAPATVQQLTVTTRRPFIGNIDSQVDEYQMPPTTGTTLGRTLIQPNALIADPLIPVASTADSVIVHARPFIDIIGYVGDVPGIIPGRAPRELRSRLEVFGPGDPTFYLLPTYGRAVFDLAITNYVAAAGYTFEVRGLVFTTPTTPVGSTLLTGPTPIPAAPLGNTVRFQHDFQAMGAYDYIEVLIDGAALSAAVTEQSIQVALSTSDRDSGGEGGGTTT